MFTAPLPERPETDWLAQLQVMAQQQPLSYLHFWGHAERAGTLTRACLSQWYPAPFVVAGVRYATAEHWMMAAKARCFDPAAVSAILTAPDPAAAKALGRAVRQFDAEVWQRVRFEVVVQGNLAKFSQNPALRDFLLNTGEKILVEASPHDRIWGVGLDEHAPEAHDPARWRGLNLLGFALMQVRSQLQQGR